MRKGMTVLGCTNKTDGETYERERMECDRHESDGLTNICGDVNVLT
jgi:hypothetical protein